MYTHLLPPFPGAEFSPVFDESSVDECATVFGSITPADAQLCLETSVGRHSTVHCATGVLQCGKDESVVFARMFPEHRLAQMYVIKAMSSPIEVSVKQNAVTQCLLRYFKV